MQSTGQDCTAVITSGLLRWKKVRARPLSSIIWKEAGAVVAHCKTRRKNGTIS